MIQKKVMGHITEQSPHRNNQLPTLNYINNLIILIKRETPTGRDFGKGGASVQ